jgi:hypothetical protein
VSKWRSLADFISADGPDAFSISVVRHSIFGRSFRHFGRSSEDFGRSSGVLPHRHAGFVAKSYIGERKILSGVENCR